MGQLKLFGRTDLANLRNFLDLAIEEEGPGTINPNHRAFGV